MNNKISVKIRKLTYSALFLAIGLVLPFLTGQIPQIGSALSPMHIPVLLCGFVCGWPWGLAVGVITPLLRSLIFGMPPMYPVAVAMAFELAAYGAVSGILYKYLSKKPMFSIAGIYITLIVSMIAGRLVWGLVQFILLVGIQGGSFTMEAFLAGAVLNAVPGIILHIVLIPVLVIVMKKARLILND